MCIFDQHNSREGIAWTEILDREGVRTLFSFEAIQIGRSCDIPSESHVILTCVDSLVFVDINSFNFHAGQEQAQR